jgi:hypothetical protein
MWADDVTILCCGWHTVLELTQTESFERNREWGQSSLLTLVMRERLPVSYRRISQNLSPAGVTSPVVARANVEVEGG